MSIPTLQETHTTAMDEAINLLEQQLRIEKQAHEAVHGLFTSTYWLLLNGKTHADIVEAKSQYDQSVNVSSVDLYMTHTRRAIYSIELHHTLQTAYQKRVQKIQGDYKQKLVEEEERHKKEVLETIWRRSKHTVKGDPTRFNTKGKKYGCEGCRQGKLVCDKKDDMTKPCSRCERNGIVCVKGVNFPSC